MRKWNARRKFRQGALGVIATNRMNKMMEGLSTAAKTIEQEKAVRCRMPSWVCRVSLCARAGLADTCVGSARRVGAFLPPPHECSFCRMLLFCAARSAAVIRGQAP